MAKKWANPLDRLLEADTKAISIKDNMDANNDLKSSKDSLQLINKIQNHTNEDAIVNVDVKKIIRWKHKDRPENELGNIEELAATFKSVGQQQPCILRVSKEFPGKYEIIVGERRWRAAEMAGLKLKAVIQDIDDKTATLIQAIENDKRSDISEFAKGMSFADKIDHGLVTQKDLVDLLGVSKQQITRLLSFKKIPEPLFNAIEDFRKVSARTAYELARLANKNDETLSVLLTLTEKIREGKYGANRINSEVEKALSNKTPDVTLSGKVIGSDGRHLFTWRKDNNSAPSIHFPNDILKLIHDNSISFDELTKDFKECLTKKLAELKE